jgi:hypothetical protein
MFVRTQKAASSRRSRSPEPQAEATLQEYLVHRRKKPLVVEISEKMTTVQINAMQERADINARLSVLESKIKH